METSERSGPLLTDAGRHVLRLQDELKEAGARIKVLEAEAARGRSEAVRTLRAIEKAAGEKRGVEGTVTCPTCGGVLRYSVAKSSGRIRAACSGDCRVSWRE